MCRIYGGWRKQGHNRSTCQVTAVWRYVVTTTRPISCTLRGLMWWLLNYLTHDTWPSHCRDVWVAHIATSPEMIPEELTVCWEEYLLAGLRICRDGKKWSQEQWGRWWFWVDAAGRCPGGIQTKWAVVLDWAQVVHLDGQQDSLLLEWCPTTRTMANNSEPTLESQSEDFPQTAPTQFSPASPFSL